MSEKRDRGKKPRILFISNYYLPGYKRGGGLRTVANIVERFKDRFDFLIITRDHDGDKITYPSVKVDKWNEVKGAEVFYLPQNKIKLSKLRELIVDVKPDSIYLNSVFSTLSIFLLILRKLKKIPLTKIVLAPQGELSDGALQLKASKKKLFINFAKSTGLYRNIIWKMTTELEKEETQRFEQRGAEYFIAADIPSRQLLENYREDLKPKKNVGQVKTVFLSRFMRKKNFKWLAENLSDIRGDLEIDIIGPLEDKDYWDETMSVIKKLPANVKVEYKGEVEYERVMEKLSEYHFLILPTLGENFGHVFIEALAAGCPLIISDRTPWLSLEEKAIGWDIPLESPQKWLEKLNYCINLDNVTYSKLSANARGFASQWLSKSEIEEDTLRVLKYSLK